MFCPQCGTIIGRDAPADLFRCPRCHNVIKVLAFAVEDDVTNPHFITFDGAKKRLVGLYVSEAMVRFQLSNRTARPEAWEELLVELEEERLKAFAKRMGWLISRAFRDPGPRVPEASRPFGSIEQDLKEGLVNTFLVSGFERVPRRDLFRLYELAEEHGARVVCHEPHQEDENLRFDNLDYETVPLEHARNPMLTSYLDLGRIDELVTKAIGRCGWLWTYYIADLIGSEMGAEQLRAWRAEDQACKERHWKDVLTYFAIARARKEGLVHTLDVPKLKACGLCRRRYLDAAIPLHLAELTRFDSEHCRSCLAQAFFYTDEKYPHFVGPEDIDSVGDLEETVGLLQDLSRERFASLVKRVNEAVKASADKGRAVTPSTLWLEAMRQERLLDSELATVLPSDTFFRSADGHLLGSFGAAALDNYLNRHGVPHRLDAKYPRHVQLNPANSMRADFVARNIHVEFLGLRGHDEFDKKIEQRVELARRNRLRVIGIYAEDLINPVVLDRKCEALLSSDGDAQEEAQ